MEQGKIIICEKRDLTDIIKKVLGFFLVLVIFANLTSVQHFNL
jgi:hypothetical protein